MGLICDPTSASTATAKVIRLLVEPVASAKAATRWTHKRIGIAHGAGSLRIRLTETRERVYGVYMTSTTRSYVRHAGDQNYDVLAERDRKIAERRAELDAHQAELRESDPELAAIVESKMRRR